MKKRKILVAVLCCSLALVTVAYATNATKTIQAAYMNIKLVIDGVPVTPKDSNGTTVEPFIYNGTTYLPVRAVGEALGKQVGWDGKGYNIYLDGRLAKTITVDPEAMVKHYQIPLNNALQMKIVGDMGSVRYGFANVSVK